jgi:hypothetical protein
MATKILAKFKDPITVRRIGVIDLARVQFDPDSDFSPHPEYISVGKGIKINPPANIPNDSVFSTIILTTKRNLLDPLGVKITVGTIDPTSRRGRSGMGDEAEFFETLAEAIGGGTDGGYTPGGMTEYEEALYEQDELIWDYLDTLGVPEPPSDTDGDIQPVGDANDAGTAGSGVARADHTHLGIQMIFDASWTQQSDLGTPDGMAIGYLDDGAGTDEGAWFFPPDGTTNADWIPLPSYN